MNVLIISYFNSWVTHFGTELELAERHLAAGDRVEVFGCDRSLTCCEANPSGRISKCDRCRLRRTGGLRLLSAPIKEHSLGDYLPDDLKAAEAALEKGIVDAKSAELYEYNGHDFGSGALSSVIWNSRDPFCEKQGSHQVVLNFAKVALRSYLGVRSFLKAHPDIQRVYIFNGRFASTRGALRACQEATGVEVFTHERGPNIGSFSLFENAMPHDRALWVKQTLAAWDSASDREQAVSVGSSFFIARKHGTNQDWTSFTEKQQVGKLPTGWDHQRRNVVIFNSSEDEFVGLGEEWLNPIYAGQAEGVQKIVQDAMERYPNVMFYLRMHPNLVGVNNRDTRLTQELGAGGQPNLVVVAPDSDISTYSLLDAADLIITFGSTVGVEATYWGKPSILAGHAMYEDLDSVYVAESHEHLMELIETAIIAKRKINAIIYGYYAKTFGEPFQYWVAEDFSHGKFRGKSVKCEPKSWLVRRLLMGFKDLF
jgi:hypothetical protein